MLSIHSPTITYTVLKTLLNIILLIWKKGADPRPSPTEDRDDKRNLDFVARMGEMIIVYGPEGSSELDQLLSAEQMLRLLLVHDQAFFNQSVPYPLARFRSARSWASSWSILTLYTARLSCSSMRLPVTRANSAKNHSAKVFIESAVTSSVSSSIIPSLTEAINRRKSLIVARSRGGSPSWRPCAPVAWETSTALWLSESTSSASCVRFSTRATHLFNTVSEDDRGWAEPTSSLTSHSASKHRSDLWGSFIRRSCCPSCCPRSGVLRAYSLWR